MQNIVTHIMSKGVVHLFKVIDVADLDKLYFATQRHLKGSIAVTGELARVKELDFSAHSKLLGGSVDAKLHNDDFHADMRKLNTLGLLKMLIYPEIIGKNVYLNSKSKQIDAKLDINANNNPLKVALKGSVDQPKVTVDASKLIEKKLKKEAGKQINKLLKGLF
ncbi:MAG: hypothetical protein PF439_01625 [Helicobacteraceae bacterium]|nr:hypothetical protein [Helicobacteraceae bacterium]